MTEPTAPLVDRRALPGTFGSLSVLTISVDPPAVAPPAADARTVALLRRARKRGVTTFDVAAARHPPRAERLIATAFPAPDPEITVIVGRSVETLADEHLGTHPPAPGGSSWDAALLGSVEPSRRRLAPVPIGIVEWEPETRDVPRIPELPALPPQSDRHEHRPIWAIRLRSPTTEPPDVPPAPPLFAAEFSLLQPEVPSWLGSGSSGLPPSLIARNPFSDGRLDGSRFASATTPMGPGEGLVDVRKLHEQFDPVLRLGFLTEGRRRTLAQAALWFDLGRPGVVTCVIPLPPPERFEEIVGFASSPPLDEGERARLALLK